ncbi:hypothetical protein FEM48_Zijuj08G0121200 [Ziziphus jujuba var. spinosa]|uniref:Uncharacterized protein n=1 Tax=Ziziphus jujuba var. spinosa TaxID=714518 RepID=A0A978UZ04_ZIZJJ|nr:hypothetical protein FEM48_Zijuj08G0121200 [Ziziphus jujuba var. spinosa]
MGSESDQLRIFFFPLPAPGHMIPMVDEARLFAKRGVDVTIIITQGNASFIQKIIDREFEAGHKIRTHILQFPSAQVGLPDGIENYNTITSMNMGVPLFQGLGLLQKPIEQLLHEIRPDCIVSDMFYPWTLDVANKLGIPRLGFRGMSHISMCAEHCIKIHEPHKSAESNVVLLPGLPHKIKMLISQLPDWSITTNDFTPLMDAVVDSEQRSYGMLMNSFHELENDYEQYFKTSMGLKAWSVGPVSLWVNRDFTHKAERHKIASNAALFQKSIDRDFNSGHRIKIHVVQFPSAQVGLPDGIENFKTVTSLQMCGALLQGMQLLQNPIEQFIQEMRPDCIVADMFFPWSLEVATRLGIPRVHEPHKSTESDVALLPGFPDTIEMPISKLPE